MIYVQSDADGVIRRVKIALHRFHFCRSRGHGQWAYYCTVLLLQQLLPSELGKFYTFPAKHCPITEHVRQPTLLPVTSPNVHRFKKSFLNRDSAANLWQSISYRSQHISNASLHYLVISRRWQYLFHIVDSVLTLSVYKMLQGRAWWAVRALMNTFIRQVGRSTQKIKDKQYTK